MLIQQILDTRSCEILHSHSKKVKGWRSVFSWLLLTWKKFYWSQVFLKRGKEFLIVMGMKMTQKHEFRKGMNLSLQAICQNHQMNQFLCFYEVWTVVVIAKIDSPAEFSICCFVHRAEGNLSLDNFSSEVVQRHAMAMANLFRTWSWVKCFENWRAPWLYLHAFVAFGCFLQKKIVSLLLVCSFTQRIICHKGQIVSPRHFRRFLCHLVFTERRPKNVFILVSCAVWLETCCESVWTCFWKE